MSPWIIYFSEKNLKNVYVTKFDLLQLECAYSALLSHFAEFFNPLHPLQPIKTPNFSSEPKSNYPPSIKYTTDFDTQKMKRKTHQLAIDKI